MHAAPRGIDGEIEEKITEHKHGNFKISLMYVYMESTDVKNCEGTKTRVIDEDDRVQDGDEGKKKEKSTTSTTTVLATCYEILTGAEH